MMTSLNLMLLTFMSTRIMARNCDYSNNMPCLNVFDSEPSTSPKCYCTKTCPIPLEELKRNCSSGQLHPDQCSTCLQCAKSRGQECGGLSNRLGVCGVGLRCLVQFNVPKGSNGRLQENNSAGECVSEDSKSCPGPEVEHLKGGVNCRPGRLGIVADALYCPSVITNLEVDDDDDDDSIRVSSSIMSSTQSTLLASSSENISRPPPKATPSFIQILLDRVPKIPDILNF